MASKGLEYKRTVSRHEQASALKGARCYVSGPKTLSALADSPRYRGARIQMYGRFRSQEWQHLFPPVISNTESTKIPDEDHQVKTNINFKTGQKQKCFINIDPSSEGSLAGLYEASRPGRHCACAWLKFLDLADA